MAWSANMSPMGEAIVAIYPSTAWNKASNPWYAVNLGGTESINSGSTIDMVGKVPLNPKPIFSCVSSFVMTVHGSASVPVPAVVVMQTMGRGLQGMESPLPEPP